MRYFGFRILTLCLALSLLLSPMTMAMESALTEDDKVYTEAIEVLTGLNLIKAENKNPAHNVTRAEFADILVKVLGWETLTEEEQTVKGKYLGYTNDPDFDSKGDWVWQEDASETDDYENATPFKDVLTTHEYWSSIRLAARSGIMTGDPNKYFRPNGAITLAEAEKVLVYACGSAERISGSFPGGVLQEASRLGITSGIEAISASEPITYRDAVVLVYNALGANVYEAVKYSTEGVEYKESKDETLLSYYRSIYMHEGIVTENRFTSLTKPEGTDDDVIYVDDIKFKTDGISCDDLLGQSVDVYYTEPKRSNAPVIVYIRDNGYGDELIVEAQDIVELKDNYLYYQKDGQKQKKEYIGSQSNIIYNGKALTDYTDYSDDILVPEHGSIRFVDADSNGSYETVFVNSVETVIVSAIDYTQQIIYNKMDEPKSVALSKNNTFITDADGIKYELTDIPLNSVLDVKRTLDTQGELLVNIERSFSVVTGVITSHDSYEREITLDGDTYKYSLSFDESLIEMGPIITFYMNTAGEIIWAKRGTELTFGYLAGISYDNLGSGGKIKLYDLFEEEFEVYELADKVVVNKVSDKAAKLKESSALYDLSSGEMKAQLIKYKLNSDGKLNEILTANVDENEFVEQNLGSLKGKKLKFRNVSSVFVDKIPAVYMNEATVFSSVPVTNYSDEELYRNINLVDNLEYKVDRVYKNNLQSAIATVILMEDDLGITSEKKSQLDNDNTPVSIVKSVRTALTEDGEECVVIKGTMGNTGDFSHMVADDDLMKPASELKPGDLIRFETAGKHNYISRLIKIFDVGDLKWHKAENPLTTNASSYDTKLHAVHGRVVSKLDDGAYIVVAPYIYSVDSSGNVVKGDIETDESKYYTYPTAKFRVYKFNSEEEKVTNADAYDVISIEESGIGSEVVAYTRTSTAISLYIFE